MPWGKKWPVQMNLPFFAVKAYVPGGGPESGRKKFEKCLPAGTGTKIYFSSRGVSLRLSRSIVQYGATKRVNRRLKSGLRRGEEEAWKVLKWLCSSSERFYSKEPAHMS